MLKERQYVMVIDLHKCIGCHACTAACKQENFVPKGVHRSWVTETEAGKYPDVRSLKLPRLCNHCAAAPCLEVCPTGATYRTVDGTVQVNAEKCVGCRYCLAACPYDARFIDPVEHVASKCSFCYHRITDGLMPACVSTCVGQARYFGDINDPDSDVSRLLKSRPHQSLRPELGTKANVFYYGLDDVQANTEKTRTAKGGR